MCAISEDGEVSEKKRRAAEIRIKKVFLSLNTDTYFQLGRRDINAFLLKNNRSSGHKPNFPVSQIYSMPYRLFTSFSLQMHHLLGAKSITNKNNNEDKKLMMSPFYLQIAFLFPITCSFWILSRITLRTWCASQEESKLLCWEEELIRSPLKGFSHFNGLYFQMKTLKNLSCFLKVMEVGDLLSVLLPWVLEHNKKGQRFFKRKWWCSHLHWNIWFQFLLKAQFGVLNPYFL